MAWVVTDSIRGPRGERGDKGERGADGANGASATIVGVGARTLSPSQSASVEMSGAPSARSFTFGIPRGQQGERGFKGDTGTISSASAESVDAGEQAVVVMSGTDAVKHAHFKVPRGLPGLNGVENDEAFATYIAAEGTETAGSLSKFMEREGAVVNVMRFGAAADGLADDTAAFQATIDAALDGGNILIPPGTYRLDGTLTNVVEGVPKSIHVTATGAVFVKSTNTDYLDMRGEWSAPVSVSSMTVGETPESNTTLITTALAVETTPLWSRGDVVKVVANNIIPGSRSDVPSPAANAQRVGQFASVFSAENSEVLIAGVMSDPMTTGVRVARLERHTVSWTGGVFTFTDSYAQAGYWRAGLRFEALHGPVVRDVTIERAGGQAIGMVSCYGYRVSNVAVGWARNNPDGGAYGYGVNDVSSHGGVVEGSRFAQVRHAYTDDTGNVLANSTNISLYGRPRYASIVDCVGMGGSFNTHHTGEGHTFSGCSAVNMNTAYALRGRNHTITDVHAQNCNQAVLFYTEADSGESNGHRVDGVRVESCVDVIALKLREGTGHPNRNVRDTVPSTVRGVYATGVTGTVLNVKNGTILVEDVYALVEGPRVRVISNNSTLRVKKMVLDIRPVEGVARTDLAAFNVASPSNVEFDGLRVIGDVTAAVGKVFSGASPTTLHAWDVVLDSLPFTDVSDGFGPGSFANYSTLGAESSGALTISGVGIAANLTPIGRRKDPIVTVEAAITSSVTLGDLPIGRKDGQILLIVNTSTGSNLTVQSTAARRTLLEGDTGKTIPAGGSIMLVWSPSVALWRQVKTP